MFRIPKKSPPTTFQPSLLGLKRCQDHPFDPDDDDDVDDVKQPKLPAEFDALKKQVAQLNAQVKELTAVVDGLQNSVGNLEWE